MSWLKRIGLGKKDPSTPRQAPSLGKGTPSIKAERLRDSGPILSATISARKAPSTTPIELESPDHFEGLGLSATAARDTTESTNPVDTTEATESRLDPGVYTSSRTNPLQSTKPLQGENSLQDARLADGAPLQGDNPLQGTTPSQGATPIPEHQTAPADIPEDTLFSAEAESPAPVQRKNRENPAMRILRRGRQRKSIQTPPNAQPEAKQKKTAPRPKKGKKAGRNVESVALGVTLNKADFWIRLRPDGTGENLNISNLNTSDAAGSESMPFFRLTEYDKGILLSKKLRGKNLRNAMIREREISDIPVSFLAYNIRWFTRKTTAQVAHQPVHPLGASLFAYAKAQGWHPEKGILLYSGITMQDSTLWIYLAIGKNGIGIPQVAHINAEADRPLFNMSYSAGLLASKDYETHAIPPEALFQWLSKGRHRRYPQPDEWFGLERIYVGRGVMALGITACLAGGVLWWFGNGALHAANLRMARIQQETVNLNREKQTFLRAHLPVIAYSFQIPLRKDLQAAFALWKPGTQVILADGLPLPFSSGGFQSPLMANRGPEQAHAPAKIAIIIPESKNLGDGQSAWVSPKILSAVIQQPARDGFHLQHIIRNSTGGGYVVIFGKRR
ncbi:hypothetical protein DLNHIDIE_00241 [Acidithiobacillus thiooxidans ATCC 19377]|uniref:Uncharacterized protein n=1 Tax=Acidithiobacillus thiooxidans ATCC 19377 TaxID=637390 RepID=A0A543Q266_ACITH|nr:hypothetical protein DLNHIDIE_00241 [Acidithiobacillus thiooxidans ATCC 19377]